MNDASRAVTGMSPAQARAIERSIIVFCTLTLILIFQPFSKLLSGIGMGLVVPAGLAFNLVPLCEPGQPAARLLRATLIILAIFVVVLILAISSAYLYGIYLQSR